MIRSLRTAKSTTNAPRPGSTLTGGRDPLARVLRRLTLVCLPLFATPAFAQSPGIFGNWINAPSLLGVLGTPAAELTVNGSPYLLLVTPHPLLGINTLLWNPTDKIFLTQSTGIVINSLDEVVGLQMSSGPRVFLSGDFEVAGTATRIAMWDGTNWTLPGGAVTGVAPRSMVVRETPTGPELWVGGSLISFPGITGPTGLARFDGTQWSQPGALVGFVEQIVSSDESHPSGDVLYLGGMFTSIGGISAQGFARYDGTWDPLPGAPTGTDATLSVIELAPGDVHLWVTLNIAPGNWEIHSHQGGVWTDRTPPPVPPFSNYVLIDPGPVSLLPTSSGSLVFLSSTFANGSGIGSGAWDPLTGTWLPTSANGRGALSFESPSGLFPTGIFRSIGIGLWEEWHFLVGNNEFIRGDVNVDGLVNIADPILLLEHLFLQSSVSCLEALDTNSDDNLNVGDPITLLQLLFSGSPLIQAPYPNCGPDLTPNALGCANHPICP